MEAFLVRGRCAVASTEETSTALFGVSDNKLEEEVDEHVDESESTSHARVRKMFFAK